MNDSCLVEESFEPFKWVSTSNSPGYYFLKISANEWIEYHKGIFFAYFTETSIENDENGLSVTLMRSDNLPIKLTPGEELGNPNWSNTIQTGGWERPDGIDKQELFDFFVVFFINNLFFV